MPASFKEYIKEKYFDYIYNSLKKYIYEYKADIPFRLKCIDRVDFVQLEDAYIKQFYIYDDLNNKIGMTIIVQTEVSLIQNLHGEPVFDYDYPWFTVECSCSFNEEITKFKISSIEPYDYVNKEGYRLSDNLVPIISKEQFDSYADLILKRVYPEALEGKLVNPYEFARRLNLTIKEVRYKNENRMGSINFEAFKRKKKNGEIEHVSANTIEISKNVGFLNFEGCKNFTIMHECVHYILHRKAFKFERLFDKAIRKIDCYNDDLSAFDSEITPRDWMEWQANNLAPRLIMPTEQFKNKVDELLSHYQVFDESFDDFSRYEKIIYELSKYYSMSIESVKIRLIEVGYEFPLGCFIEVDGKRVMPHAFKDGALKRNETFAISEEDAAHYCFNEKQIKKNDRIDGYIYVDAHLCINHPKYITKNRLGKLTLTTYARKHMDECCIKFEIQIPGKIRHHEINYNTFKMLNRKKTNASELVVKAYNTFDKATSNNNDELLEKAFEKVDKLYLKIPRTSNGVFKILKDYSGYTNEELSEITGLSKSALDDYLYTIDHNYSKHNVIRLLLAMNIPPKVSFLVLELCRCTLLAGSKEDQWLYDVLQRRWRYKYEDNLTFLKDRDIFI